MSNEHNHGSSVATYVIVALVLGVITYIEFAIVEYEIAWLSSSWILFWLVLLSVAKFILVIMFFMHLKDDDNLYTGFFGSGMVFALGTFVVLALLFTLPATFRFFSAERPALTGEEATAHGEEPRRLEDPEQVDGHGGGHGDDHRLADATFELITSDGYSRPMAQIFDVPRPKDLRVRLAGPALPEEPGFTLSEAPPLFERVSDDAPAGDAEAPPEDADPADLVEDEPPADAAAAGDGWDQELGEEVYAANCASCHQGNGAGIQGAFPPLAGNMPELYGADGGREYLVNVMLYGLQGQIEAGGSTYNGVMPAWPQLSDEEIAAVLNHELTAWENASMIDDFNAITADEVAGQRGQDLDPGDVHAQREALDLP